MTVGIRTVVYPVRDLDGATALFRALTGAEPTTQSPYYVGFRVDGQEVGLDPNGHAQGRTGPVAYWHVADAAATVQQAPQDVGGGKLVATLLDADGNVIGLIQPV